MALAWDGWPGNGVALLPVRLCPVAISQWFNWQASVFFELVIVCYFGQFIRWQTSSWRKKFNGYPRSLIGRIHFTHGTIWHSILLGHTTMPISMIAMMMIGHS